MCSPDPFVFPEYTTAVAVRALLAFMIRNNSKILFSLPTIQIATIKHLEKKKKDENKLLRLRILMALLILSGISAYFFSPLNIAQNIGAIATLLGGIIALRDVFLWISNEKKAKKE